MVIGASPSTKTSALQTTRLQLDRICMENSKVRFVDDSKLCVRVWELRIHVLSSMVVEWLQAKQAHLVWKRKRDRRGKSSSSKLLISDRESSLSCDSISVEWRPGVCVRVNPLTQIMVRVKVGETQMHRLTTMERREAEEEIGKMAGGEWVVHIAHLALFSIAVYDFSWSCLPCLLFKIIACRFLRVWPPFILEVCFWKGCYYSQMVSVLL